MMQLYQFSFFTFLRKGSLGTQPALLLGGWSIGLLFAVSPASRGDGRVCESFCQMAPQWGGIVLWMMRRRVIRPIHSVRLRRQEGAKHRHQLLPVRVRLTPT